jgi:aspartate/methionine/tyrosine aminotransferase
MPNFASPNQPSYASRRAQALPENVFLAMDAAKAAARQAGRELIDLSIGSSDLLPPPAAMTALARAVTDPSTYGYCLYQATLPLRQAVTAWMSRRFALTIATDEVLALIGSQEGLAHALLAFTDPGDVVLAPNPAYPSYFGAFALAGVVPYDLPLVAERGFLPDLGAIPVEIAQAAKVLLLSYPNNPTAGVATAEFWQEVVAFATIHDLIVIHDFPYSEMTFGEGEAPSILAVPGAKSRCIELYSCSKSYHMPGFRLGFAVGGQELLYTLGLVKGAIDFNQYLGIQQAGIAALASDVVVVAEQMQTFRRRRDAVLAAMADIGWHAPQPRASMYVWAPLPRSHDNSEHRDSFAFCSSVCEATGVALSPGRAYGSLGEGWVRIALVRDEVSLQQAVTRIAEFLAH